MISDLKMPNGIVGSSDGKLLYVADPGDNKTYVYAIEGPGTGGMELNIGDLHLTITRDSAKDRIRVRVERSEPPK